MLMSSMTCPPQVMTGPAQTHDLSTYRYGISCWEFPKAHTQGGMLWRCLHVWLCLGLRRLWAKALDTGGCFLVARHSHNYLLRRLHKWVSFHSTCKIALRASGLTNAFVSICLALPGSWNVFLQQNNAYTQEWASLQVWPCTLKTLDVLLHVINCTLSHLFRPQANWYAWSSVAAGALSPGHTSLAQHRIPALMSHICKHKWCLLYLLVPYMYNIYLQARNFLLRECNGRQTA